MADRQLWTSDSAGGKEYAYIAVDRKKVEPSSFDLDDIVKVTRGKFESFAGKVVEFDTEEVTIECEVKKL